VVLGKGKKGVQLLVELLFAAGFVVWAAETISRSLHAQFRLFHAPLYAVLIDAPALKAAGAALIIAGFVIFIAALKAFGSSWRVGIDERTPGRLITSGIYAVSRNPITVFLDLFFIGMFLINGTVEFLLFALSVAAGSHYQILQEEKTLPCLYGRPYGTYRAAVGRYVTVPRVSLAKLFKKK
jgi:protein-S-isoprenylcysteine O-methyltransferase Ste14